MIYGYEIKLNYLSFRLAIKTVLTLFQKAMNEDTTIPDSQQF